MASLTTTTRIHFVYQILPASRCQLRRNNNDILLVSPRLETKKTMGDRSFMVPAPVLWNSLPLSVTLQEIKPANAREIPHQFHKTCIQTVILRF